jgi:hypothetical protein
MIQPETGNKKVHKPEIPLIFVDLADAARWPMKGMKVTVPVVAGLSKGKLRQIVVHEINEQRTR